MYLHVMFSELFILKSTFNSSSLSCSWERIVSAFSSAVNKQPHVRSPLSFLFFLVFLVLFQQSDLCGFGIKRPAAGMDSWYWVCECGKCWSMSEGKLWKSISFLLKCFDSPVFILSYFRLSHPYYWISVFSGLVDGLWNKSGITEGRS